jgi:hypothetical protein
MAVKPVDVLNLSEASKVNPKDYSAGYSSEEKPVFFGHYWLEVVHVMELLTERFL